ncbi:tetratricopeptide repeat protein [Pseudomonas capsici]|uniref:tetratricopeptide repeat protein n=1 Tax=Pseudomonas capsici TaxID=2810614 RepID=UPI000E3E4114|nr:tetratricopeptide repeat protein [Pseudomonas capsici]MCV4283382.1 sel1 repeat family protein [Pseudomonas capsici]
MNRVLKKRRLLVAMIFATSGLSLFHGSASAYECPSEEFTTFLTAFSTAPQVQQRFTASTVTALVLKPAAQAEQFEPQTIKVRDTELAFPLMAPMASDKTEGVVIENVDDSHVNVIDKRAGNSNIKIFKFTRQTCWVLGGMEDWSISEKDLLAEKRPDMSRTENYCYQRAEAYSGLAGAEQYTLTTELFEATLENYLCAAASGDPEASLDAASLSLSGMAPQLETAQVEALLKAAATTLADGAASLSTFYCYGNDIAANGVCQHPDLAEKELVRAASMGSVDAINYLGYVFEEGKWGTKDVPKAMACYRLAADKGNQTAATNVQRLKTQAADLTTASHCY